jgi:hypothetical protein
MKKRILKNDIETLKDILKKVFKQDTSKAVGTDESGNCDHVQITTTSDINISQLNEVEYEMGLDDDFEGYTVSLKRSGPGITVFIHPRQ